MAFDPVDEDVVIEQVVSEDDIEEFFRCCIACFGLQLRDPIWLRMNRGFDTPEGYKRCVKIAQQKFCKGSVTHEGHAWFLRAVLVNRQTGRRRLTGVASWNHCIQSRNPPSNAVPSKTLEELYPDNPEERAFLDHVFRQFYQPRCEVVQEAGKESRSIMILEVLATHPDFQRRGIGQRLVQWGINKSKELAVDGQTLECWLEATAMGKSLYEKAGFTVDRIVHFDLDAFAPRTVDDVVMMRRASEQSV